MVIYQKEFWKTSLLIDRLWKWQAQRFIESISWITELSDSECKVKSYKPEKVNFQKLTLNYLKRWAPQKNIWIFVQIKLCKPLVKSNDHLHWNNSNLSSHRSTLVIVWHGTRSIVGHQCHHLLEYLWNVVKLVLGAKSSLSIDPFPYGNKCFDRAIPFLGYSLTANLPENILNSRKVYTYDVCSFEIKNDIGTLSLSYPYLY